MKFRCLEIDGRNKHLKELKGLEQKDLETEIAGLKRRVVDLDGEK